MGGEDGCDGGLEAIIGTNCQFICWVKVHIWQSLGILKTYDCGNYVWPTSPLHDLYVDISYKFTLAWVYVSYAYK